MVIRGVQTHKIVPGKETVYGLVDRYIKKLSDHSILVITSKIISICEGRTLLIDSKDKDELIKTEAEYYIPRASNKQGVLLTIKHNTIIPTAGIDESNSNGHYVLWPKDPQKTANDVRKHLLQRLKRKVGVLITDSKSSPLRWGTTGIGLAHSGFDALNSYIEKPDIFGRRLKVTKANVIDSLAAAAVAVMGEGNEQTPFAVIENIPFVKFRERNPSQKELNELYLPIKDDIFAPLLESVQWKKGGGY